MDNAQSAITKARAYKYARARQDLKFLISNMLARQIFTKAEETELLWALSRLGLYGEAGSIQATETEPGDIVGFAGHRWTVLEHLDVGVLVIMQGIHKYYKASKGDREIGIAFTANHKKPVEDPADWRTSDVRWKLVNQILVGLLRAAGEQAGKILPMKLDLTAIDGSFGIQTEERIGLLTIEQYRRYRDIIPDVRYDWWLLTRNSECDLSRICKILSDGSFSASEKATSLNSMRPVLLLAHSTEVDLLRPVGQPAAEPTPTAVEDGAEGIVSGTGSTPEQ